jgi:hypothetical protein
LSSVTVLPASYVNFFRLIANVPGETDEANPLIEFTDYANARQAYGKRQLDRLAEILITRGYEATADTAEAQFEAFVQNLPPDYPLLATDRQFSALVVEMSTDVKRELRRLARSDEVQSADPAMGSATAKVAPPYEQAAAVAPGTTVLWIADKPNTADHAVLPPGVNLIVATSTDEARRRLSNRADPVSLVISDIGRGDRDNAGLEDLRAFREENLYAGPAVFYTVRPTRGQVDDANRLGATVTSSLDELRAFIYGSLPLAPPPQAQTASSAYAS